MDLERWLSIGEILILALIVYGALISLLRITGKRTTSKMNSFDWIVTVALGSMVATIILVDDVPLIEGLAGIAGLIVLQYLVAWLASRSRRFQRLVKASPCLLYYGDEFNDETLLKERVTRGEIIAAVRAEGYHSLERVSAVVMETNADLSVIPKAEEQDLQVLENVTGWNKGVE